MFTSPLRRASLLALLGAAVSIGSYGCDEYSPSYSELDWEPASLAVAGPWLHALHPTRQKVYVFDVQPGGVDVTPLRFDGTPLRVEGTDDSLWLLTAEPSTLTRVDVRTGERRMWPLPAAYSRVAVRNDGAWVAAWYGQNETVDRGEILYNANQVSVIDTSREGADAVRTLSLNGVRPERFVFLPPVALAAGPVDYTAVLGDQGLALVRLEASTSANDQRIIPLGFSATDTANRPEQLVYVDTAGRTSPLVLLRALGSDLLFAVELSPGDPETGRELQPSVNVLTMPGVVSGVHPFERDGQARLLVTTTRNRIAVVDPVSGVTRTVDTEQPIRDVLMWTEETGGSTRSRALLIPTAGSWVALAELDALEIEGSTALRVRRTGLAVASAEIVGDPPRRALLRYRSGGGIGLLDLERGTETTIPSRASLTEAILTPTAIVAGVPSQSVLATVDLESTLASTIELVAPGISVLHLPERDAIIVTHESRAGWYTFLSTDRLSGAPLAELRGIYLENLLDDGGRR